MIFKNLLVTILLMSSWIDLFAQNSEAEIYTLDVTLNYSETNILFSENVQDSFYIYIKLPKYYNEEISKSYPVIYLLDGDIAFPIAYSVVRYLQFGKFVPDMIIVGIGYGGLLDGSKVSKRERDYTISKIERWKDAGNAENFKKFLEDELIPYLESKYRIDASNRTLSGHSLGGLFTLYTLFTEPQLFSNYIASSPYISYDVDKLLSLEEKNNCEIDGAGCKLFISFGEDEDREGYDLPISRIVNQLRLRDSNYIKLDFRIFEEGIHFSTPSEAMVYGLLHSFK